MSYLLFLILINVYIAVNAQPRTVWINNDVQRIFPIGYEFSTVQESDWDKTSWVIKNCDIHHEGEFLRVVFHRNVAPFDEPHVELTAAFGGVVVQHAPGHNVPNELLEWIEEHLNACVEKDESLGAYRPLHNDALDALLEARGKAFEEGGVSDHFVHSSEKGEDYFNLRSKLYYIDDVLREKDDDVVMTRVSLTACVLLIFIAIWLCGEMTTCLQCFAWCSKRAQIRSRPRGDVEMLVGPTVDDDSSKYFKKVQISRRLPMIPLISETSRASCIEGIVVTTIAFFFFQAVGGPSPQLHSDTARDISLAIDCSEGVHCEAIGVPTSVMGHQGALWIYFLAWCHRAQMSVHEAYLLCVLLLAISVAVLHALVKQHVGIRVAPIGGALMCYMVLFCSGLNTLWNPTLVPVLSTIAVMCLLRASHNTLVFSNVTARRYVFMAGLLCGIAADLHLSTALLYPMWMLSVSSLQKTSVWRNGVLFTLGMLLPAMLFSHSALIQNAIALLEHEYGHASVMVLLVCLPIGMFLWNRFVKGCVHRTAEAVNTLKDRRVGNYDSVLLLVVQALMLGVISVPSIATVLYFSYKQYYEFNNNFYAFFTGDFAGSDFVHEVWSQGRHAASASAAIALLPCILYELISQTHNVPLNTYFWRFVHLQTIWMDVVGVIITTLLFVLPKRGFDLFAPVLVAAFYSYRRLVCRCRDGEAKVTWLQGVLRVVGVMLVVQVCIHAAFMLLAPCWQFEHTDAKKWYSLANGTNVQNSSGLNNEVTIVEWTIGDIETLASALHSLKPHWTYEVAMRNLIVPDRRRVLPVLGMLLYGSNVHTPQAMRADAIVAYPIDDAPHHHLSLREPGRFFKRKGGCGTVLVKPLGVSLPPTLLCVSVRHTDGPQSMSNVSRTYNTDVQLQNVPVQRLCKRANVARVGVPLERLDELQKWHDVHWNESVFELYGNAGKQVEYWTEELSSLIPNDADPDTLVLEVLAWVSLAPTDTHPGDAQRTHRDELRVALVHNGKHQFQFEGMLSSLDIASTNVDVIRAHPTGGHIHVEGPVDGVYLSVQNRDSEVHSRRGSSRAVAGWLSYTARHAFTDKTLPRRTDSTVPYVYFAIPKVVALPVPTNDAQKDSIDALSHLLNAK